MNVFEESLVCRVDCKASTFVELSNSVVQQFCGSENAQIPRIAIIVCIFRVSADSDGGAIRSSVIDWVNCVETVNKDFVCSKYYSTESKGFEVPVRMDCKFLRSCWPEAARCWLVMRERRTMDLMGY